MGRTRIAVMLTCLLLAACSTAASGNGSPLSSAHARGSLAPAGPSIASQPAAAAPSGSRVTLVRSLPAGSACDIQVLSDKPDGANEVIVEHFTCPDDVMSDARLSGRLEMDLTTTYEPAGAPTARWEGSLTITNAGGSWKGTGRGAVVMWADRDGAPTNYGEGTYTGTGAYVGLVYHEFIAGGDASATLSGWIDDKP
jgi:hypothetical protein